MAGGPFGREQKEKGRERERLKKIEERESEERVRFVRIG